MATTSPDNIWTPDSGDNYALTTDLAATADTIQDALDALRLNGAISLRGTTANRPAFGVLGRTYRATDTGILWYDTGSAWRNIDTSYFCATRAASQSIPNNTTTDVVFTGVTPINQGGAFSFNASTGVLTVNYDGDYEVSGSFSFVNGGSVSSHVLILAKNNPSGSNGEIANLQTTNVNSTFYASTIVSMSAGDNIRMRALHASGSAKNIFVPGGAYNTILSAKRLAY